ncbi:MAG: hypothetical protein A2Y04_04230 [Omnitrophica WOR_2 bacterium GWC2_45_7]|nr:MAG: hypothetical protein A2Y04_04230 [Omnitrophica WOR_2 bacterium GWC2_45_7]
MFGCAWFGGAEREINSAKTERRRWRKRLTTADVRPFLEKADEPGEAPQRKFWSVDGSFRRAHGFSCGAPREKLCCPMKILHSDDPNFVEAWTRGEKAMAGVTVFYTRSFREYERLLFGDKRTADDSFVVLSAAGEVAAIVPLYAFANDEGLHYGYGLREYLRGPLFANPPGTKTFDQTVQLVVEHIQELADQRHVLSHRVMIEPVELMEGRNFFNYYMDFDYEDKSAGTSLIECHLTEEELRTRLRKSYKPLINRAQRQYNVMIIHKDDFSYDLCDEYRKLHALAAGRQTRGLESFQKMYEMIKEGKGFLVLIREGANKMVGAYYFLIHRHYAFYGSAATHPESEGQSGIGHLGLWQGILFARRLGAKFLDLGQLLMRPEITEKEKSIDFFKDGFGGRRVVVFRGIRKFP